MADARLSLWGDNPRATDCGGGGDLDEFGRGTEWRIGDLDLDGSFRDTDTAGEAGLGCAGGGLGSEASNSSAKSSPMMIEDKLAKPKEAKPPHLLVGSFLFPMKYLYYSGAYI